MTKNTPSSSSSSIRKMCLMREERMHDAGHWQVLFSAEWLVHLTYLIIFVESIAGTVEEEGMMIVVVVIIIIVVVIIIHVWITFNRREIVEKSSARRYGNQREEKSLMIKYLCWLLFLRGISACCSTANVGESVAAVDDDDDDDSFTIYKSIYGVCLFCSYNNNVFRINECFSIP